MSSQNPRLEDHARAERIAERRDLFDELLRVAGITPEPPEVTQPLPVIACAEQQQGWLSPS